MRKAGLLAVATLILVACAPSANSSPSVQTNVVDLPPSYVFQPANITVKAGTTVTWTNHDNFTHSVLVNGQSDVHMMKPGESAQITFATPGQYHYVCTLHTQNMQGTVTVT
jgi:plastocyanin